MAKECLFLCTGPVNDLKTYLDINYIDYKQGLYNLNIYSIDIIGLPGQIASYNCVLTCSLKHGFYNTGLQTLWCESPLANFQINLEHKKGIHFVPSAKKFFIGSLAPSNGVIHFTLKESIFSHKRVLLQNQISIHFGLEKID